MKHPKHTKLFAGYSFYNVATTVGHPFFLMPTDLSAH